MGKGRGGPLSGMSAAAGIGGAPGGGVVTPGGAAALAPGGTVAA